MEERRKRVGWGRGRGKNVWDVGGVWVRMCDVSTDGVVVCCRVWGRTWKRTETRRKRLATANDACAMSC